ncbi:MAG: thiamine pyrophosphate-binding protein [Desulfobacterales bacterium]|nr:thiamine pyrophosphate-binding protein [Desulfobacterales bacterium]
MSTVAKEIVTALRDARVDKMFGIPGGGPTADMVSACADAGIEFVLTQHETSAVIMAGIYAQRKGTVGVAVSAIGPGVANLANGVAQASLDRLPVLIFADRQDAATHATAQRQCFDHLTMMAPVTKARLTLHENNFLQPLRRAVRTALSHRQGPVFIDFPGNVGAKQADPKPTRLLIPDLETDKAVVSEASLQAAAAKLSGARHPVILAGLGALFLKPGALDALANALHAPVFTSPKAKGAIAADDPFCAGVFMGGKIEEDLLNQADVILFVGYDPVEMLAKPWTLPAVNVSLDTVPNTEQIVPFQIELVGDLNDGVKRLQDACGDVKSTWSSPEVSHYKANVIKALEVSVNGMTPNQVILTTREIVPRDTILVTDVGANKLLVVELWEAYAPNDFLMSNGLASMGFCLPAAQAAKLAEPQRPVVCLCGDAGFMMRLPELLTGKRHNLPIVYVVFSDDGHSLITVKQAMKGFKPFGVNFPRPDYIALAKGFGLDGVTVETVDQYRQALKSALSNPHGVLVEARIDPSGYQKQFDAIREL